jgi:antitoxin ParD1/3/4
MEAIQLNLPDDLRMFLDEQVTAGGFSTPETYLQSLLDAERRRKAREEFEELLLAGVRSPDIEMTPEEWESMWREAEELAKNRAAS